MAKLIYPELSYEIVGCVYDVYNSIGFGHQERVYQVAVEKALINKNIPFKREVYIPVKFNQALVGKYYLDFLIDAKIILELKIANVFYSKDVVQILAYLKALKCRLGILILFSKEGIKYKRIVN